MMTYATLLDDLERDLTLASTVPASSATMGHVNPLVVDLTVMDTASEHERRFTSGYRAGSCEERHAIEDLNPPVANLHKQIQCSGGDQEHSCHSF